MTASAQDSAVVFTEVNYSPVGASTQWIELHCINGVNVDISGWRLAGDVSFTFPSGSVIAGRGHVVVALDPSALSGASSTVFGPWTGQLDASSSIELVNRDGRRLDELDYGSTGGWPVAPNGSGATLAKLHADRGGLHVSDWAWSPSEGGSPGRTNFPTGSEAVPQETILINWQSTQWRYRDAVDAPPSAWAEVGFDDSAWDQGQASLGVGTTGGESGDGLLAYWPITETSGTVAHNEVPGGGPGVLHGATFTNSSTQDGQVLQFGGGGSYVDAGSSTLPLLTSAQSLTWSFWANSSVGDGTSVVVGNRFKAEGGDSNPMEFVKFTPSSFEFYRHGSNDNLAYAGFPTNQWVHHVVVKNGTSLSYYRNGAVAAFKTLGGGQQFSQPLYFGGDRTSESWQGHLDDIAIWDRALTADEVTRLASKTSTPLSVAESPPTTPLAVGRTTYYFRRPFIFAGALDQISLSLQLLIDDGAIVYLNGQQIHSRNMPPGTISHDTLATAEVVGAAEAVRITVPATALLQGTNVLAVEVHQHLAVSDPDVLFDAQLIALENPAVPPDSDAELLFNEISQSGEGFQLELVNLGSSPVDASGYQIRSSTGA